MNEYFSICVYSTLLVNLCSSYISFLEMVLLIYIHPIFWINVRQFFMIHGFLQTFFSLWPIYSD